jgi:hypothetical protein
MSYKDSSKNSIRWGGISYIQHVLGLFSLKYVHINV